MLEKIEKIFREEKVLSIEDLKEKLNIESAKEFVELVKNVGKLERKLTITQLPNEKFLYVKGPLEIEGVIRLHQKGFAFVYSANLGIEVYIPKGFTQSAMTGDVVLVKVDSVYKDDRNLEGIVQKVLMLSSFLL